MSIEFWPTCSICSDACFSVGSHLFLERTHAAIADTVSMSNAVWATLVHGSWWLNVFSEEAGSVLLDASESAYPLLQNLSLLYLGWLCGKGCLLGLGGSVAWKLHTSLEFVFHLVSMWLIYLPGFLLRQNVRTRRDIGDLWIQHFISQLGKAKFRKGRWLSRGSTASTRQGQPSCLLPHFRGCLTPSLIVGFYRNLSLLFLFSADLSGCPCFYDPSLGGNT